MRKVLPLLGLVPLVLSCNSKSLEAPPPPTFPVMIRVESDPGVPMPGAQLTRKDQPLGVTGPDGKFSAVLQGTEGDVQEVKVVCPQGFESPTRPIQISLRRLSENRPAEYSAYCPPNVRRVVVVIRAENGPFIPIVHLNQVIGRTDASGAATFLANVKPNDQLEFTLLTSNDETFKRHHPQDPKVGYLVQPQDEVVVLTQEFKVDKPPPPPVYVRPKPQPILPTRRY
jgi:hypothetical protein